MVVSELIDKLIRMDDLNARVVVDTNNSPTLDCLNPITHVRKQLLDGKTIIIIDADRGK